MRAWKVVGKYPFYSDGEITHTEIAIASTTGSYATYSEKVVGNQMDKTETELVELAREAHFKSEYADRAMAESVQKIDDLEQSIKQNKTLNAELREQLDFAGTKIDQLDNKMTAFQRLFVTAVELTDEQKTEIVAQYPDYGVGVTYQPGQVVAYEGTLYEVVQGHTSQADWKPSETASLYKLFLNPTITTDDGEVVDVVNEFVQPAGAHDAYKKGDRVTFGGKVYASAIDNNVYSPTAYPAGWTLVE
ncbi:carbohydrate-binding protein [Streptococcus hyovaginalis]